MTFASLLRDVAGRLDRAGVSYMLTGSLASSYYGEPRASLDLDVVIDPDSSSLARLVDDLQAGGYYVDRGVASEALEARSQFNAIDAEAVKVDLIIRKDRPFSIEEFRRRRRASVLGTETFMATVEDVIIVKLEWAALTDSDRQRRDVQAMLRAAGQTIDRVYLDRWLDELGLRSQFELAWSEAT